MNVHQLISILTIAIAPGDGGSRQYVEREIARILEENPSIRVKLERSEGHIVLSSEDELELEAISQRILEAAAVEIGEPKVAFRETIRKVAEAEGKYIRQTGGSSNYGHCWLRIEPNEPGKGYEFIDEIKGGVVLKEYVKPIDMGARCAMESGVLTGFPMVDVKVTLFDGSYHEVDSNEMAFKIAGSIAFKEAVHKAKPVLLEPVMAVEATVPEEFMGVIIGDINSRRGRIEGIEHVSASQVIKAIVPLAELLRSSHNGRPDYSMQFARYEPVPPSHGSGDNAAPVFAVRPRGPMPKDHSSSVRPENE